MSEKTLPQVGDSDETQNQNEVKQDVSSTQPAASNLFPMPEDWKLINRYNYHKIDAGMVEVSLALAALVFTVAALLTRSVSIYILFILMILVLSSNLVALWFLAAYCIQQKIIHGDSRNCWHNPLIIYSLIKNKHAGVYRWLANCLLGLVVMFILVFLSNLSTL
ncbi:MAG: hypothetical protein Q9P44_08760 [Anaerolineae bacterium]|nr:hypothetical protein [Anaerolineae bacterium]